MPSNEHPAAMMVQREMATVMKALVLVTGDTRMSDACIALGRLGAWAEAGLTPRFAIETLPDPSQR